MENHQNNPKFFQQEQKQQRRRECIFEAVDAVNAENVDLQDCLFFPQNQSMNTHTAGNKQSNIVLDSRARKRENDKAYRERCKEKKIEMKCNFSRIGEENGQLKQENENLKKENSWVNQMLQTQSREMGGLKNDVQKLKLENQKQIVLVQTLSNLLVSSPDLQDEYHQLMNENFMLKQNTRADLVRMVEENVSLKHENRVLTANKDALCAKLVKDGGNNYQATN